MNMNGNDIFIGAYAERHQSTYQFNQPRLQMSEQKAQAIQTGIKEAMEQVKTQRQGVSVSISKEDRDFLCSEEGFLKAKKDAEDLYIKNASQQKVIAKDRNPEDLFWGNTGNQWLVFSEALYRGDFYKDMSDSEVKEFEDTLAYVTSGMDRLSRSQYMTGIDFSNFKEEFRYFMTSAEAGMELESSTAALRYLSDKMLPEEHRAEFNKLIDMYYAHNSEVMAEYNNPMESFNKVISSIQSSQPQQVFSKPVGEYQYTVMLGGIDKTVAEKKQYQNGMAALFEKLRTDGDMTILWDEIKEKYLDYSTNGSANNAFRNYVSNQSQYLFNHMEKTWNQLLNKEEFKDILAKSVIELTGQTQSDFHSRFTTLNSKSKEEGGIADFVENALTVYAQMYDEIKKGYADGTREVWIADKSAVNGYRKATEEEEIAALDKAMEFHAMVVDGYLNYGVQAGLDAQEAMERTRTMLENKEYVARFQRKKEEGTEGIYRKLLEAVKAFKLSGRIFYQN